MYIKDINKIRKPNAQVEFIIGECDSGKTSYAVTKAIHYMRKGYPVFSNMYIKGAVKFDLDDLMRWQFPPYSVLIIDEAATYGLASRGTSYKDNNKQNVIEFFTMYRHYLTEHVVVISPSFDDVLPIVRSRVKYITVVVNSIFNKFGFGATKTIGKKIDVVDNGGSSPKEIWKWDFLSYRLHYRKIAFKNYDTFSRKELPRKEFITWNNEMIEFDDDNYKYRLFSKETKFQKLKNINFKLFNNSYILSKVSSFIKYQKSKKILIKNLNSCQNDVVDSVNDTME